MSSRRASSTTAPTKKELKNLKSRRSSTTGKSKTKSDSIKQDKKDGKAKVDTPREEAPPEAEPKQEEAVVEEATPVTEEGDGNQEDTPRENQEEGQEDTPRDDKEETPGDKGRRHSSASRKDGPEVPTLRRHASTPSMRKGSLAAGGKSKRKGSLKAKETKAEEVKKEEEPQIDPQEAFRQFVYETIRTTFQLVTVNNEININVDNVFPVMKTLELDPNDEVIMDMVRTSCIETFGDISEKEFDDAVIEQRKRATGEEFEEDLRSAFAVIDKDEDGFINSSDIYQLMMGLGEMLDDDELADVVKAADYDKDGQINYRDFKYFLIGILDDLPKEEGEDGEKEGEEANTEEKKEGKEEGKGEGTEEKKETEGETKEEENKEEEEVKEENKEVKEEVKEEQKPTEPPKPKPARKSILWGYVRATTNVVATASEVKDKPDVIKENKEEETKAEAADKAGKEEEKKEIEEEEKEDKEVKEKKQEVEEKEEISEPEKPSVRASKHDSGIGSEADSVISERTESASGVISVTVKHLQSITEENSADEDVFEADDTLKDALTDAELQSRRTSRPPSSTSHRTRPLSAVTAVSIESGVHEEEEEGTRTPIDRPLSARPKSAKSRPTSASQRTPSAMSRATSSRLSTHSERDFLATDTTDTVSVDLDIQDVDDDDFDPDTFRTPRSARQVRHLEHFAETQATFDVPTRQEIVYTAPSYCNYKDPKDHFQRFPRREGGIHILERAKSASRIQTIRRLEHALLRRQNTDPKIDLKAINQANERTKKDTPRPTNINGMVCKHINIDLDFELIGPSAKFESYSRDLLRRPKTAQTFHERCKQIERESLLEQESRTSPEPVVSIIDLSRSLKGTSTGYPENPELSLQHSGYKSVWPLARVKSARNQRVNQGKNIELNSFSRRLERVPIAWSSNEPESPKYNPRKGLCANSTKNQAVVTLEIPNLARTRNKLKRVSPLSGLLPRTKLRG